MIQDGESSDEEEIVGTGDDPPIMSDDESDYSDEDSDEDPSEDKDELQKRIKEMKKVSNVHCTMYNVHVMYMYMQCTVQ